MHFVKYKIAKFSAMCSLKKGERGARLPFPYFLQAKVNIFPGALTLFAQAEVARVQLHDLEVILLGCNLSWSLLTQFAAKSNKGSAVPISEDAALEDFTRFFVGELTYLHLGAVLTSKCQ